MSPRTTIPNENEATTTTTTTTTNLTMMTNTPLHFVLVHGFKSGGWCWYKTRCLLEKSGHKVSSPDLKSAGIDPTEPDSLRTFDEYNKPLIDLLASLPENEKVILVGHSAGGLSLTDASYKFGDKIQVAVYVAATMLKLGFQTEEDLSDGVPEKIDAKDDDQSCGGCKPKHYVISPEDRILKSILTKSKAPDEAVKNAKFNENPCIDKVKRVYIKTTYDEIVKPGQQETMIKRWPPSEVFSVDSDHFVLLSAPMELFSFLIKSAQLNI